MTDRENLDFGTPAPDEQDEAEALEIEAECLSHWMDVCPEWIRRRIADLRTHGDLELAYEYFAIGHREDVRRRRRRRTKHYSYYEFDVLAGDAECAHCGWRGPTKDHYDHSSEVIFVNCPDCGDSLVLVSLPTFAQTKAAAASGDPRALRDLQVVRHMEARTQRARRDGITLEGLPDIDDEALHMEWDQEARHAEEWTILLHQGVEIAREPAFYAGQARFDEVVAILRQRYGSAFRTLSPTRRARPYILGDRY